MQISGLLTSVLLLAAAFTTDANSKGQHESQTYRVAVTTSLLECAVQDVFGADQRCELTRLIPPGNCPGHFDITPGAVSRLKDAELMLRHDYQQTVGRKFTQLGGEGLTVEVVETPGSFLIPRNYAELLRQVSAVLIDIFPETRPDVQKNQQKVLTRLTRLEEQLNQAAAVWKGAPVIVAAHQKQFVKHLGFRPVGELKRPSDMSARDLQGLLNTAPALIVGNLQSNADAARNLASRMDVPVAVLTNFPGTPEYGSDYFAMVRKNLQRLQQAWQKKN